MSKINATEQAHLVFEHLYGPYQVVDCLGRDGLLLTFMHTSQGSEWRQVAEFLPADENKQVTRERIAQSIAPYLSDEAETTIDGLSLHPSNKGIHADTSRFLI